MRAGVGRGLRSVAWTGSSRPPREDLVMVVGNGDNIVFIDYEHDIVAMVRWIDDAQMAKFARLLEVSLR